MSAPVLDRPVTDGGMDSFNWEQLETEFAKPCQGHAVGSDEECPEEAKWIAYSKQHALDTCPGPEVYLCEKHMKQTLEWWKTALAQKPPIMCTRCNVPVVGLIKDHLHAIRL